MRESRLKSRLLRVVYSAMDEPSGLPGIRTRGLGDQRDQSSFTVFIIGDLLSDDGSAPLARPSSMRQRFLGSDSIVQNVVALASQIVRASCPANRHSAIDEKRRPGHEARRVGGNMQHRTGKLLVCCNAFESMQP